jgi:hypothetical protein
MRRRHLTDASIIQSQVVLVVLRPERSSKGCFFIGAMDVPMQSRQPLLNLEVVVLSSRVIVWRIQLLPQLQHTRDLTRKIRATLPALPTMST